MYIALFCIYNFACRYFKLSDNYAIIILLAYLDNTLQCTWYTLTLGICKENIDKK
jgi:hypothetical protein